MNDLAAVSQHHAGVARAGLVDAAPELRAFLPLRDRILDYWKAPGHRRERSWIDHRDINDVMLATLAPEGYLAV